MAAMIETGWLSAAAALEGERAIAQRVGRLLRDMDDRWVCTPTDLGRSGTVRIVTEFAGEPGPVIRIELDTLPEHAAEALHDHFVQPVREAARQRRAATAAKNNCDGAVKAPPKCADNTSSKQPL